MKRSRLKRRTPLRARYRARVGLDGARRVRRSISGGRCEADTEVCTGRAVHIHHVLMRSRGGSDNVSNLLDVCVSCHSWIHEHPSESYDRGWLHHAPPTGEM